MKRKNPEFVKTRRFIRKTKFSENLSSTSYLYLKLFFLWFLVVLSDFLIEFRFEYLWPIYLLVRNIYNTFRYQGLAFSAFFLFVTLTSNAICFFLMPVQWLFFTASTYVWFQFVWNSEKGICLQTFTVWLIFVYIEATVRLKELKNIPGSLDICRPMAAHSLGSQVVMLGFGFKKYLNYKIMLRRQKDVRIDNELTFYTINKFQMLDNNQLIKDHNNLCQQSQFFNINSNDNEDEQLIADQLDQQNQEESEDDDKRISPNSKDKYDNNDDDLNNSNLEERKLKSQLEIKLSKYSNRQLNQQQSFECGEQCKLQKKETDELIIKFNKLKDEQQSKDLKLERLNDDLQNQKSILLTYLNANSQLEGKLKEETKLKLELFSVLGETRRQLDINKLLLYQKQSEVDQLNNKLAEFNKLSELIAIMPNIDQFNSNSGGSSMFLTQFLNSTNNSNNNDLINDDLLNQTNNNNFNNINNSNLINNNINQQTSTINSNLINTTSRSSINHNNLFNISNNSTLTTTSSSNSLKDGSLSDWKQINLDNLDYEQSTGENSNHNSTTPIKDL